MKHRSGQDSDVQHCTPMTSTDRVTRDVPQSSGPMTAAADTQPDEALARSVAVDIGPRRPGVTYVTGNGALTVLDVITDRSEARRILRRKAAQFAILVRDPHTGSEYATCTVWTGSDRVLKAVSL